MTAKIYREGKEEVFAGISDLMDKGLEVVKAHASPAAAGGLDAVTWLDYSEKIVGLLTKDFDKSIHLNYLKLLLALRSNNSLTPGKKVVLCLEYLYDVLKIIREQL